MSREYRLKEFSRSIDDGLRECTIEGKSAAPANAVSEFKHIVHYVSAQKAAEGMNDILNYWGL